MIHNDEDEQYIHDDETYLESDEDEVENLRNLPICDAEDSSLLTGVVIPTRLYKRRWFILFVFSLNCIGNAALFTSIAGINDIASKYYNVEPEVLNWIPNSFLLVYIFIALPSAYVISSFGLRDSLIIGSSLNAVACCLHFAGNNRGGFSFVITGQICAATAVGSVLQIPPKLATVWFGVDEHATSISIGYVANILGMAIGYVQSTQMVRNSGDMTVVENGIFYMNLSQMVFTFSTLFLTYIGFQEKPPLPPSTMAVAGNHDMSPDPSFLLSLTLLAGDRDFNLYTQAYGLCFGVFVFTAIVLNEMLSTKMAEDEIGWVGFAYNTCGIIGMLLYGVIIDKYKCYKSMSIFLLVGGLLDWIAITLVFLMTHNTDILFILLALLGFFIIPFMSVGVEQGSVTTYPVPEEISSCIMLMFGNLYGFVFVLFLGDWISKGRIAVVCYIVMAIFSVAIFFACTSKVNLKKLHTPTACIEDEMIGDASMQQVGSFI